MKGQLFVSPRDFVGGAQLIYQPRYSSFAVVQASERSPARNEKITLVQLSIVDGDRAPEQSGNVRGTINFAGWMLE